jgi:WD40 repeat protein
VSNLELQDLISFKDELLNEVFQYSKPDNIIRVPIHVWFRLQQDLKYLIIEKTNNCFQWYHRQLWETAQERYDFLREEVHRIMGNYFGNLIPKQVREERLIQTQELLLTKEDDNVPIWFSTSKINQRRTTEAAYHLIQGNLLEDAIRELCNFENICGRCLVDDGYEILLNIHELKSRYSNQVQTNRTQDVNWQRLTDYHKWMIKEITQIVNDPRDSISTSAFAEPDQSAVRLDWIKYYNNLLTLVSTSNDIKAKISQKYSSSSPYWLKEFSIHGKIRDDPLLFNCREKSAVMSVDWNHHHIAIGCFDSSIKIYDDQLGTMVNSLFGNLGKPVRAVKWHPKDPNKLATGGKFEVVIWHVFSGQRLQTLSYSDFYADGAGLGDIWSQTICLSWNVDGSYLVGGAHDGEMRIWEMDKPIHAKRPHQQVSTNLSGESYDGPRSGVSFHPTHPHLCVATWITKNASLINVKEGLEVGIQIDRYFNFLTFDWSSTGEYLLMAGESTEILLVQMSIDMSKLIKKTWSNSFKGAKILHELFGHRDWVTSVRWCPGNDNMFLSASKDCTLKIWRIFDMKSRVEVIYSVQAHMDRINEIQWSKPDDSSPQTSKDIQIISVGEDHCMKVWKFSSFYEDEHGNQKNGNNTNVNGQSLMGGPHTGMITSVAYYPFRLQTHDFDSSCLIMTVSEDSTIKVWNSSTGQLLHTFIDPAYGGDEHYSKNTQIDGSLSEKEKKTAVAQQLKTDKKLGKYSGLTGSAIWNHSGKKIIQSFTYSSNIYISDNSKIKLNGEREVENAKKEDFQLLQGFERKEWILQLATNSTDILLSALVASRNTRVNIWDLTTGKVVYVLDEDSFSSSVTSFLNKTILGEEGVASKMIEWHETKDEILTLSSKDSQLKLWSLASPKSAKPSSVRFEMTVIGKGNKYSTFSCMTGAMHGQPLSTANNSMVIAVLQNQNSSDQILHVLDGRLGNILGLISFPMATLSSVDLQTIRGIRYNPVNQQVLLQYSNDEKAVQQRKKDFAKVANSGRIIPIKHANNFTIERNAGCLKVWEVPFDTLSCSSSKPVTVVAKEIIHIDHKGQDNENTPIAWNYHTNCIAIGDEDMTIKLWEMVPLL